jgi:1-acyl-sn-glycerol-3-phosphate acyltransferase
VKVFSRIFYEILAFFIRLILRLNGGLEVRGIENIPLKGGALIASNHISYIDPPMIGAITPRMATFMARKGLFDVPVISFILNQFAFPVDREKPRPSTMKEAVKRLKGGALLVMFPEGRRSETGQLMEAKRGAGMIVSLSKAPIIPVYVHNTDKILPVDAKWLKRGKVTVVFDKPIYYQSTISIDSYSNGMSHDDISGKIMDAIGKLKRDYEVKAG